MIFTLLGAVAELERSLIVERVKAGLRNARAKGKRLGAAAGFGFRDEDSAAARRGSDAARHCQAQPVLQDDGDQGPEVAIAALSTRPSLPRLSADHRARSLGSGGRGTLRFQFWSGAMPAVETSACSATSNHFVSPTGKTTSTIGTRLRELGSRVANCSGQAGVLSGTCRPLTTT